MANQVILTHNWPEMDLANGSRGVVIDHTLCDVGHQAISKNVRRREAVLLPVVRLYAARFQSFAAAPCGGALRVDNGGAGAAL